jgi:hypothetical protein
MTTERPDLNQLDPAVRAYIESLEAELDRLRAGDGDFPGDAASPPEPSEPPTPLNVITLSALEAFPSQLEGKYQSFTEADLGQLRGAGYPGQFRTVEQGVEAYVRELLGT